MSKVKLLSILTCLVLIVIGTASVQARLPVAETNNSSSTTTLSIKATQQEQQKTLTMWTREARLAARPLPFSGTEQDNLNAGLTQPITGQAGFAPGSNPQPNADSVAQGQFPQEWLALENELLAETSNVPDGTAGVFTSYLGNYYSQMYTYFPFKAVGKLNFRTPSGNSYCTASVISPYNILVTAAHCVYDTVNNTWYSNWAFVPAARGASAPYGTFPWSSARVLTAWVNATSSDRRYDVALIRLGNNSSGYPVTYYTGNLGRSWNFGYTVHLHAVGYPSNLNSGLYTYICAAETFYGSADVLGMGCDMTYGSSGGPWIKNFAPYASGANNYVNSVVSGGTPGTNTFYGARFSGINIVPLCTAEGC